MSRGIAIFKATGTVGGSVDKLDSIDGATGGPGSTPLQQGDLGLVVEGGYLKPFEADADSGAAENDPFVVAPDNNGGPLRWLLIKIKYLGHAIGDSLTMAGVNPLVVNGVAGGNTPVGAGMDWYTNTAPSGWLLCDGSEVSRATYAALFAVIGTTYGSGDGATTFNLPDVKGRTLVGRDAGDSAFNILGKKDGEKEHQLTIPEMPEHSFEVPYNNENDFDGVGRPESSDGPQAGTTNTNSLGGDLPHNNLQPYLVANKIIKY